MGGNHFSPVFSELPATLAIFPLPGAILLPHGQLPLNIFEPRYLNMVLDALGQGRMIGMIQPDPAAGADDGIHRIGCAGRITRFNETEDGRLLILLTGVCRFEVSEELDLLRGYRRVVPDWRRFRADLDEAEPPVAEIEPLMVALTRYCEESGLEVEWEKLRAMDPVRLVNFLAINLPFGVDEKQSLVEAVTPLERARLLTALAEFGAADPNNGGGLH